jgi:hypothetical protein
MEQQSDTIIWPEARVAAFWDRPKLTYDKWLIAIFKGDARSEIMLKQSMLFMEVRHFVALIGVQRFIDHYPDWRKLLIDNDPRTWTRRGVMDSLWSWQVCGTIYMKNPTHEWFQLTKKQKATFYCISEFGYESIYRVAKRMNRNYRRVLDDVKRLIALGVIQYRVKTVKGRRSMIVGL